MAAASKTALAALDTVVNEPRVVGRSEEIHTENYEAAINAMERALDAILGLHQRVEHNCAAISSLVMEKGFYEY